MASLTDLKKLRNTTGRFKNNAHQQRGVATEAEGLVVLGRGQLQPANKKKAEKAAIDNELMMLEMSQMEQQLAMRRQMMYRGIGTPQWVGTNGNQGISGKWVSGRRTRVSGIC